MVTLFQVCLIFFACWHYVGMGGGYCSLLLLLLLFVCLFFCFCFACMFYCVFVAVGGGERASLFSSLFFSFLLLSLLWLFRICLDLGAFFCLFWKWSWIVLRLCLLVSVAVGLLKDYSSLKTLNHFFFLTWLIYTALMEYSLLYNLLTGQQDFFDNVISLCFFVAHGLQDFQL